MRELINWWESLSYTVRIIGIMFVVVGLGLLGLIVPALLGAVVLIQGFLCVYQWCLIYRHIKESMSK